MDFEDLFDGDHRDKRQRHGQRREDVEGSMPMGEERDEQAHLPTFARQLVANRRLLILLGFAAVGLIVLLVIFVLPLVVDALDYVNQNGLKGAVDRVWQGAEPAGSP